MLFSKFLIPFIHGAYSMSSIHTLYFTNKEMMFFYQNSVTYKYTKTIGMKIYFAGLMLLTYFSLNAQTTTNNYKSSFTNLSIQKIRTVLLWDEKHTTKQNAITLRPVLFNSFGLQSTAGQQGLLGTKYSAQTNSPLLTGLAYGLVIARSFTKYGNMPNTDDANYRYYRVNSYLAGQGNSNTLFGRNAQWQYRQ